MRAIRLIRLVKLVRSSITLRCLLDAILTALKSIGNFMIILGLLVYVYALLGMQMFAGQFKFDQDQKYDMLNGTVPR
jgi:voltage-dependent calcium channel N type alpha-1B